MLSGKLAALSWLERTCGRVKTLTEGEGTAEETAGACSESCRTSKVCNAWFWCDDQTGCETEMGLPVAFHGCQLQTQRLIFPIEPPTGWKTARFVAGYDGGDSSDDAC